MQDNPVTEIHCQLLTRDYMHALHPGCRSADYKKPTAEKNSHKKEEFPNQQIIPADPTMPAPGNPVSVCI